MSTYFHPKARESPQKNAIFRMLSGYNDERHQEDEDDRDIRQVLRLDMYPRSEAWERQE